jgi:AcrR family transcriptional regulator
VTEAVTAEPGWQPEPLPRGRHKLAPDAVRASQRERLLRAMLQCVAADGYAATTVPRVAAAARVSPNTFYAQFTDKADCFLELCDQESRELLAKIVTAGSALDWREAVRAGVRIYLSWWRERPQSSRAYLLELPSAGANAQQQRREAHERFVRMFLALAARARHEQPALPEVSEVAVRVMTAGQTELVAAEVAEGRLDSLGDLEDVLVRLIIRALADDATAAHV